MKFAHRPEGVWACVLALLLVIGIWPAVAAGQIAEEPVVMDPAAEPEPEPETELSTEEAIRQSRNNTFEIHVQGADLRGVLQLLSTQGRRNIIATQEVKGSVTADLYNVTFEEALDAVMRSTGYVYEAKGDFIYVYTAKQLAAIKQAERKVVVKVFHLAYLTANDARTLVTPALSADGELALTPAAITGISTSSDEAGGNNLGSEDLLVVRDYEENVKKIGEILEIMDVKPEQVLIEATILRASLTEDNDLGVDFNSLCGIDFEALGSTAATLTASDGTRDMAFRSNFTTGIPAGGMTFGLITNNINVFVRALEAVTDVTVVANPKLLVLNKQRGEVMIGDRDGYLTTTITETVATQTVEFLETGTRLVVRPFIGKDDYIRMEIHPEDSAGGITAAGLPSERTTEVTSNVMVRDGHTIVIGGLFREQTTNGRSQIPLLGNVPYLGAAFRSTNDGTEREEVIVLVTPHIIRQDEDEKTSEQIRDDVERFRIGQRKGLRWWGRAPLSQTHMRWARRAIAEGDHGKALWNIDMALSLQPRMEEAIRLKEQLTQEAYWADTARISTTRHMIQQMIMQELGKPMERIVLPRKPLHAENVEPEVRKAFGIGKRYRDPLPVEGQDWVTPEVNPADEPADDENVEEMNVGMSDGVVEVEEIVEEPANESMTEEMMSDVATDVGEIEENAGEVSYEVIPEPEMAEPTEEAESFQEDETQP